MDFGERAAAVVGHSNNVYNSVAAAPFVLQNDESRLPTCLSGVSMSNLALAVQKLNERLGKLENFVVGLESTLSGALATRGGVGPSGRPHGGLFTGSSFSDFNGMIGEALSPVRETLRDHERLLADVVTALNTMDAWKVAASAAALSKGGGGSGEGAARASIKSSTYGGQIRVGALESTNAYPAPAADAVGSTTTTFLDAEARIARLKRVAASVASLPSIPLVPPSHAVGHRGQSADEGRRQGGNKADVGPASHDVSRQSTAAIGDSGSSSTTRFGANVGGGSGSNESGASETQRTHSAQQFYPRRHGDHDGEQSISSGLSGGTLPPRYSTFAVDLTDMSLTETEDAAAGGSSTQAAAALRAVGARGDLLSRVQRIIAGEISAAELTADERQLALDTSSLSDDVAYRELIHRLQVGHPGTPENFTTTSDS